MGETHGGQPELWRSVSAEILKKIHDGKLVLPSSVRVPQTYEHLLSGSVVFVPPKELLKEAAKERDRARTQHVRAVWQQVIDSLPSGKDGMWGYCQCCGKTYELPRLHARQDLCSSPRCHQKADAKRNREKYRLSLAVRRRKKAAVRRARMHKAAAQKAQATEAD